MIYFVTYTMFEKHCPMCGAKVNKETAHQSSGKYFCNEEHAKQYLVKKEQEKQRAEYEHSM
jgi:YHS domain-containing protein